MKQYLNKISFQNSLEHGCSIGLISNFSAQNTDASFGIDKSFYAIQEAKKSKNPNVDFFVSDSLKNPFSNFKFDLAMGFNLLEIVEPEKFLRTILNQAKKFVMISDPYDFDRGKNSVKQPINSSKLLKFFHDKNFKLMSNTAKPSYIPWNLTLNSRTKLSYKVDLIISKTMFAQKK